MPKIVFIVKFTILGFALNLAITKQARHSRYRTSKEEGFKMQLLQRRKELFDQRTNLAVKASAKNPIFFM